MEVVASWVFDEVSQKTPVELNAPSEGFRGGNKWAKGGVAAGSLISFTASDDLMSNPQGH